MNALSATVASTQLFGALALTTSYLLSGRPLTEACSLSRLESALRRDSSFPQLRGLTQTLATVAAQDEFLATSLLFSTIAQLKAEVPTTNPDHHLLSAAHDQLVALRAGVAARPRKSSGVRPSVTALTHPATQSPLNVISAVDLPIIVAFNTTAVLLNHTAQSYLNGALIFGLGDIFPEPDLSHVLQCMETLKSNDVSRKESVIRTQATVKRRSKPAVPELSLDIGIIRGSSIFLMVLRDDLSASEQLEFLRSEIQDLAHDLRNPLGVIEMSLGFAAPRIDPDVLSDLQLSLNNTKGLFTVLTRLASPEHAEVDPGPIDITTYLQPALMSRIFIKYDLSVQLSYDVPNVSLDIYGNRVRLGRILDNLVTNAAEAMLESERRELRVVAREIDLSQDATRQQVAATIKQSGAHAGRELEDKNYIHVLLQDTGVGMNEEILEQIFERRFSTKSKSSRDRGLGMDRVHKELIEMKAALYVISQPNQGSSFHLFFPVYSP